MKKKVLFINPPIFPYRKIMRNFDCATESKGNYLYQPYDFLLLSSMIPGQFDLSFLDYIANPQNANESFSEIEKINPDIVVCAVASTNWIQDLKFLEKLRLLFNSKLIFTFGDLFFEARNRNLVISIVDGIFSTPLDFNFIELYNIDDRRNFNPNNFLGFFPTGNLNFLSTKKPREVSYEHPKHNLFISQKYRWPFSRHPQYTTVFASWGCSYSCSYCIVGQFPNYTRNATSVFEELSLVKNLGVKEVYFGDRSFGINLKSTTELLQMMVNAKLNLSWSTYFHPNQFRHELLQLMEKSGCHTIIIGIETKNLNILKKYGRHVDEKKIQNLISTAQKLGIDVCGDFIIGLPDQSESDILDTIQYAIDLNLDYASFNIATPLAGTVLRKIAIESGAMNILDENIDSLGKNKIISMSNLSAQRIQQLRNIAIRKFYLRPSYLFRRIKKIKNPTHLKLQATEAIQLFIKSSS